MIKRNIPLKRTKGLSRKSAISSGSSSDISVSWTPSRKSDKQYIKIKNKFLSENSICHTMIISVSREKEFGKLIKICEKKACTIHHPEGREGDKLTNVKLFLPLCAPCHQFIQDYSDIGRLLGYYPLE